MRRNILLTICLLAGCICFGQQTRYKAYEAGLARISGKDKAMTEIQWVRSSAIIVMSKERIDIYSDKDQTYKVISYRISVLKDTKKDNTQLLTFHGSNPDSGRCIITFERNLDNKQPHQVRIFSGDKVYVYNVTTAC
jgi:hypothetical protein